MKQQFLAVPINVYEGIVEVRGKVDLHPLHSLVLELAVRENKLESVVNAFGLDPRLVEAAIVELMYKELVYIDLERSLILVNPEVQTEIDRGRLESYLGTEFPEPTPLKWVQDIITGQIMMLDQVQDYFRKPFTLYHDSSDPSDQLQLQRRDFVSIKNQTPQTLIKAAKMALRAHIPEGDIFDRVNRIQDLKLVDSRDLYIPLKEKELFGTSNKILVPEANTIPSHVLEFWTKSITTIDAYGINDLSPADDEFLLQYDWHLLLNKWDQMRSRIGTLFSRTVDQRKKQSIARSILQGIDAEGLSRIIPLMMELGAKIGELDVQLVKGKEIYDRLELLLEKASQLVIIGSAFVNEMGLDTILPLLEQCLQREVKVILLWGGLGDRIEDWREKYPLLQRPDIAFMRSPEPFHSKIVTIDRSYAWITSCNLLSYWYEETSSEEAVCEIHEGPIIGEIIEYARSKIRLNKQQVAWIDALAEPTNEKSESLIKKEEQLALFRSIIEELKEKLHTFLERPNDPPIQNDLRVTFDKMNQLLRSLRKFETVLLIENLEHRRLLRATLHQARKSIRIGTDRVIRTAVGSVIVAALNGALDRAVTIQVRWGRKDPKTLRNDKLRKYKELIDEIRSETNQKIEIAEFPSQSHAKFLAMDNHLTVITSYNLLAFSGDGLADDEITDELGVVITSLEAARHINESFPKPIELSSKEN